MMIKGLKSIRGQWRAGAVAVVFMVGPGLTDAAANPDMIVGPNECAECHKKESAAWQMTHHYSTFRGMPRSKESKEIASLMGIKRIKKGSLCLGCHFTVQTVNGISKAIAGISCESCHSPAKEWYKVHSEFSGKKEGQESAAEIAARWEKSEAGGMIRPNALYRLAQNCFSCHLVPQEDLVNIGGHTAGSKFELVSWLQGEVRHNFWYNKGKGNPEASTERKRMMFVVGRIAELEMALIGVSKATVKKDYALKMAKRAAKARKVIASLAEKLPEATELVEILRIAESVKLKLNNQTKLVDAAARISILGHLFAATHDGSAFGAIDKFIPGPGSYKGSVSN